MGVASYEFDWRWSRGLTADRDPSLPGLSLPNHSSVSYVVAGVDEAGRGPLAGPVVTAAVILPQTPLIHGLRDSKIVPVEQREALYGEIIENALSYAIAIIEAPEIDSMNIFAATMHGMRRAVAELAVKPDLVLVDGNQKPKSGCKEAAIIKGDGLSASIMAASILAKVTRDALMVEAHELYPQYGFDGHKGYGCESHLEALFKYGPCPLHRRSFAPVREAALKFSSPPKDEMNEPETAGGGVGRGSGAAVS